MMCYYTDPEIATPPLDGTILPGVTRMSLLELAATWVGEVVCHSSCQSLDYGAQEAWCVVASIVIASIPGFP